MNWKPRRSHSDAAKKRGCTVALALLVVLPALAVDDFKTANALYDAGKFEEAAAAYEKIEPKTAHVYFNLGNAWFRQEKLGQAALNFERARRLAPRDPDILANLKFAQQRLGVEDVNRSPRPAQRFLQTAVASRTTNEWRVYELAGLWLTVLAGAGCIWLPKLRTGCAVLCVTGGVWLIATTAALGYRVSTDSSLPPAVTLAPKAPVRSAPLPDATVLFHLEEGTKAFIREDRGQWLFIERADGQQGWVKAETLERI